MYLIGIIQICRINKMFHHKHHGLQRLIMAQEVLHQFNTFDPVMTSLLDRYIDFLFMIHLNKSRTSEHVSFKMGTVAEKMLFVSLTQL